MPIRRALLSVTDKTGLVDFARGLAALGAELVSTGGTAKLLREAGLTVAEVSDLTGFPEILDGRVKTLHPKVAGGILARRGRADDMATLEEHGIGPIDLVCVNLYAFEQEPSLEQIDIGGPTLVRAAAKSWPDVAVVVRPEDYGPVLAELRAEGALAEASRRRLAATAFARIAEYDIAIAAWLGKALRYGENPHQTGALVGDGPGAVLGGKELSYNNLVDVDAALALARDLPRAGACVVKHATPCGAATGASARAAFERAYAADPRSAFGGVVGLNARVDAPAAEAMTTGDKFIECVVADGGFDDEAVRVLTTKPKWGKNLRLIAAAAPPPVRVVRTVAGGLLVQSADARPPIEEALEAAAARKPTPEEERDLRFAVTVAKHARSNAIAVVSGGALIGIGAGQTSRVEAVEQALRKAGAAARGAVLASDAFFPFRDSIDLAADAGIAAIAAPRGSKKDAEVAAAAAERGVALAFTGLRHFRH